MQTGIGNESLNRRQFQSMLRPSWTLHVPGTDGMVPCSGLVVDAAKALKVLNAVDTGG